ncbi:hypothetical protein GXM_09031 [Nostoc sphaeroides CCNUC1]|uniref:Uncharacterized protein n=1 Tax=Nostoc sphaeroides CCNUC1 TaxID=2653204 RepID=A0A5P8WFC6_9NOSO|nr:hypothetical protein GXM_09031 [Nostoc sphaeroides CCNUC1]
MQKGHLTHLARDYSYNTQKSFNNSAKVMPLARRRVSTP